MGSGEDWDSQKMLDLYIYDYLMKRNMHEVAAIFAREANVGTNPVVIDSPDGFLNEWWTIFWDVYTSRLPLHPQAMEGSSVQATQKMVNEQQSNRPTVPKPDVNQQSAMQFPMNTVFNNNMPGQSAASLLASKIYQEEHSRLAATDLSSNLRLLDVDKLTLSKPSSSRASHSHQQIPRKAQQQTARDNNRGVAFGGPSSMDSTLFGVPKSTLPRAGLRDAGMVRGANSAPLKGWALTGADQNPPRMAYPVLNSLVPVPNQQQQFQTSTPHHQQGLFSQVMPKTPGNQISSFQGSTNNFGNQVSPFQGSTNNLGNLMIPSNDLSGTDGQIMTQMMVPGRQTAEQQMTQMMGPGRQTVEQQMMVPEKQAVEQQMMVPMRETVEQQQKDQLMQQQVHENNRKRKNLSNSQAGENALDGKDAEVEKPSDDNIESFLSQADDDTDILRNSFSNLQRRSAACRIDEQNGFSFEEFGSLHSSKGKVLCCHFSSDGKLLASAGHEKKVSLWSVNSFDSIHTAEGHSHLITDVRFRPSSTIFATSSFDRTVQIWDSNKPNKSLFKLLGHAEQVNSLDFHPRKMDLLCSCDSNDEIRLWNINQCACTHAFKGATRQVRFQPRIGNLLAAASGNRINLFDVETNSLQCYLEGHVKEVRSICWDTSGKYMASVSEDSARVWSVVSGGKCIHELHSNGNKFESCTFHPGYSQLMVIGSYQSIDLWNPTESNKTLTVEAAHDGIVAALADCSQTEMIASASHDQSVKLWR